MSEIKATQVDLVEEALKNWPVADAPQGFSARILQKIGSTAQPEIKFQFTWLDYALGLFMISGPILAFLVWKLLPDPFILRLTYRAFVLWNLPQYQSLWGYAIFGIAGLLTFVVLAGILFTYTSGITRRLAVNS